MSIPPRLRVVIDERDDLALFGYLNKLVQYMAITDGQAANPQKYWNRVAASKVGKRDEDIAHLDPMELGPDVAMLLKHLLVETKRYERAVARLPNLRVLDGVSVPARPVDRCTACAFDQH